MINKFEVSDHAHCQNVYFILGQTRIEYLKSLHKKNIERMTDL